MKKYVLNSEIIQDKSLGMDIWENIFSNKEWGKYPSENLIRFIARNFYNVQDRSKINILELGLGTGANLWFCAREGFSVSGIEWSKTGVERFKKRLEDENLSKQIKEIKIGDYAQKLDEFENESFDAIIDIASLCCNDFEKTKNIFDKAISKLKPCGKFLSMTLATGLFGYEKEKGLEQTPEYGIYKGNGKLRFSTLNEIKSLYKHKDFKRTNLSMLTLEDVLEDKETRIIDKIFIIEGEKYPNGGRGDLDLLKRNGK